MRPARRSAHVTETSLVRRLLLYAATCSGRWFRNNVGVLRDARGAYVRYGLCPGSSDVIGWTPHVIRPEDVGRTVAVFTALECKTPRGTTTTEQGAFLSTVQAHGGIAAVVRRVEDAELAVARWESLVTPPARE